MSNIKSEQLKSDLSLEIALDQPLNSLEINEEISRSLGKNNVDYIIYKRKKVICYKNRIAFLTAAVTYLGGTGQHPIFKKRIQLPKWWKDFTKENPQLIVKFLGVYHYKGNIVFIDFKPDTYLKRKMNNSSAFVYTNDFYQAMKEGVFTRIDVKGNQRSAIKFTYFKDYIEGKSRVSTDNKIIKVFEDFNDIFAFEHTITIEDALKVMLDTNDIHSIRQTEWAGWYLENRIKNYLENNKLDKIIKYIGKTNKKKGELDFDLWFDESQFYGDMKASDIEEKQVLGNDKNNIYESINRYEKFWYVIYEHETDKEKNLEATLMREAFLKSASLWLEPKQHKREYKYHRPLKKSVRFKSMMIIELNRVNCNKILSIYNQGLEPNGGKRNPKVKLDKNNIENFIIYNYSKEQ